ncbi:two-component system sensor histidine kinase NtrB [Propionispora vibrioides]|uniref:histidine kinase n=1 Tax=Propionispora vibrioides TaxID=112903 RepID=A0A1H8XC16_9FIRM|nr:ATP-binding protein [Propionispora vibrioides]SEP37362.1 Signal transduction histidine kinase [Propionispora vibrioides]
MPIAVHKRAYLVITVVLTVGFLCFALVHLNDQRQLDLAKKERELLKIAAILEGRLLPVLERLDSQGKLPAGFSEREKRARINAALQPVLDEFAEGYPLYSLGLYLEDLQVVAVTPFNGSLLGRTLLFDPLRDFELQRVSMPYVENDFTWDGKEQLLLTYPVTLGHVRGHVWINCKARPWDAAVMWPAAERLAVFFICWFLAMILLWHLFRRMETGLRQLVEEWRQSDTLPVRLREYPVLVPLFERLVQLQTAVQAEVATKEKLGREISRLDRLQLVSQMAAGVAHEIRNPMTVVMGFVQMMAQKAEERSKSKFALIMDELKRVNDIISDFLSLARDKELEKGRYSLNDIIQGLYPLIYADTIKQGIDLQVELADQLPAAYLDSKETKQLILNLTRNAIEAMVGRGNLLIRTDREGDRVRLCIADTGCGIPQDILDKVFDPFFTTKAEGTGLGLAVCKSIVERHEGTIEVESSPGKGTVFTIYFQVAGS